MVQYGSILVTYFQWNVLDTNWYVLSDFTYKRQLGKGSVHRKRNWACCLQGCKHLLLCSLVLEYPFLLFQFLVQVFFHWHFLKSTSLDLWVQQCSRIIFIVFAYFIISIISRWLLWITSWPYCQKWIQIFLQKLKISIWLAV